jgi:hypothetical protein
MQYLVEGARGPLPASPEQAVALLEGTVIPHFEHVIKLKTDGKILAGGCRSATVRSCSLSRLRRMTKPTASFVTCPHGAFSNGR